MFPFKKIENSQLLLDFTQLCFDVIAVAETRIVINNFPVNDINLTNYSYEYCPTESSAGGTLLYIGSHLLYKPRNDQCIYKTAELESTFIELNTRKSNLIIGAIYKHPNMGLHGVNDLP